MLYNPKYQMTAEQCVFLAKRNIVDYIWRSARLEGLNISFSQAQAVCVGGIINGLTCADVVAVNNLKHAWQFLFDTLNYPLDLAYLCHINQVVGANLIYDSGFLRKIPVRMGGTSWTPEMPIESMIKEELADVMAISSPIDRAITLMLWSMRRQMFPDGNKRTSMLAANQVMIQNGCGVISVPIEHQGIFRGMLVRFYETDKMDDMKEFVYESCIDGVDFPAPEKTVTAEKSKRHSAMER